MGREGGLCPWVSIAIFMGVRPFLMVPSVNLGYPKAWSGPLRLKTH